MKAFVIATKLSGSNRNCYLYVASFSSYTYDIQEAALFTTAGSAGDESFRQSSLPRIVGRRTFWPVRVEVTTEGVFKDD